MESRLRRAERARQRRIQLAENEAEPTKRANQGREKEADSSMEVLKQRLRSGRVVILKVDLIEEVLAAGGARLRFQHTCPHSYNQAHTEVNTRERERGK